MAHTNDTFVKLDHVFALTAGVDVATLSGAHTLTRLSGQIQKLDPGGAHRDVTLCGVTASDKGRLQVIINAADAAENLVIKNAAGDTLGTANQNEGAWLYVNSSGAWTLLSILGMPAS